MSIHRARSLLRQAKNIAVLTGAGISVESGLPTFRGAGGLWKEFRAEDLATPEAFARDPELVWQWYGWRREILSNATPNAGHRALAEIEAHARQFTLITQNVDGCTSKPAATTCWKYMEASGAFAARDAAASGLINAFRWTRHRVVNAGRWRAPESSGSERVWIETFGARRKRRFAIVMYSWWPERRRSFIRLPGWRRWRARTARRSSKSMWSRHPCQRWSIAH